MKEDKGAAKSSMPGSNRQTSPLNRTHVAAAFAWGAACGLLLGILSAAFLNPFMEFIDQPLMRAPYAFEGKCIRIVDADTIIVTTKKGDWKVNLISAYAPVQGEKYYPQALAFLQKMLLNQDVTVQPNRGVVAGEVDAWVYAGPKCFNNELVRSGYARYVNADLDDAPLKALQEEARKAKRGLWSDPTSN